MTPISIIIITLNESQRIGNLLTDLVWQTYQNFEVIVVDSDSDDDTCEIARRFKHQLPDLTVHNMHARGVCLGRNTGAKLAKHERLLFLDADVRLTDDFLQHATDSLDDKNLEVAGVYLNAQDLPAHFRFGYGLFNVGIYLTQFAFPTAIGACMFSSKRMHKQLGGFDQSITLCEDCDYVKRASSHTQFRMLPISFKFDPRRLRQDGTISTTRKYLHANVHRFFIGEIRNNKIRYEFNHYLPTTDNKSHKVNALKHKGLPIFPKTLRHKLQHQLHKLPLVNRAL